MKLQQKGFDEFALIIIAAVIFIGIFAMYLASSIETAPSIQPRELSLTLLPNERIITTIKIFGNATNVSLHVDGPISRILSFSESNFALYGEKEIKVKVNAPSSIGTYFGYIVAKSSSGEDKIPVKITVSNQYQLAYRTLTYPDFTISNYGKEKVVDIKENDFVEKSLFSDKKLRLVLQLLEGEVEEAYAIVIISNSEGPGELIVRQNEQVLFNKKVEIGEIRVPLNTTKMGTINFITIEANNPNWNIFSKTRYEIYQAKILVRYRGYSQIFDLNLEKSEIDRFHSIEISSLIQTSYPIPTLEIKINNQIVYRNKIPLTALRLNITRDILGEKLVLSENNSIKFSLVDEGYVSFSNNIFKVYYRQ